MQLCGSVKLLRHVRLFVTPWTAAHQASLSIIKSRSPLKLMSIESVMPSNHLILCHPLLLPSIFPIIRVFPSESALRIRWPKYYSFSFIRRYFSSSSLSAIKVVSSAYLSFLKLLPAIFFLDSASYSQEFHMIYSAYVK